MSERIPTQGYTDPNNPDILTDQNIILVLYQVITPTPQGKAEYHREVHADWLRGYSAPYDQELLEVLKQELVTNHMNTEADNDPSRIEILAIRD